MQTFTATLLELAMRASQCSRACFGIVATGANVLTSGFL